MNDQLCAICGLEKASTLDHIPPKSIFPKPRPALITVPACIKCNNAASKDDEAFRVFLSLHVGIESPQTQALWENEALRSTRHNRRLYNYLTQTAKRVALRTKSGIIIGAATAIRWEGKVHDRTIEKMIRGLYFHHFGEILGNRVKIKVHWLRNINEEIYKMSTTWQKHNVGENAFIYRYCRAEDGPLHSIWLFQFYDKHWASGYTTPASIK